MTALAGLWTFADDAPARLLEKMLAAQAIYGKHQAFETSGSIALGRSLWPTTDEDAFDRGPVRSADGQWTLVADARIDNREEIADLLDLPTARLRAMSDPQLILATIERCGIAGIGQLIGGFSIGCWDVRHQQLVLARDALGERPLHYHRGRGFAAFASMPKGLHAHPDVEYAANVEMSADFLALLPETGDESFFEDIHRVLPGHIVTIDVRSTATRRYWCPETAPIQWHRNEDYEEAMRVELDRAVACRLRRVSGRTVGTHLSAGLDSSIVTATAARLLGPERLTAFTAVPSEAVIMPSGQIGDEGPGAARTAAHHPNIDHIRLSSNENSPVALMDRQFMLFERPILNPSNAVWSEAINDAAQARGIGVLLTGQMGNFTVSYDGLPYLSELLRSGRLRSLLALWIRLQRGGMRGRHLAATTLGPLLSPAMWDNLARRFGRDLPLARYSALRDDAFATLDVGQRAKARDLDLSYRPWQNGVAMRMWGIRRVDMGVYNKGTLAGWGIDMRDPTADRRLVEFALRVPEPQYILNGVPRSLARRAFADRLPRPVLDEKRRGLQGADWHRQISGTGREIAAELDSFARCPTAKSVIDIDRLVEALNDWPNQDQADEDVIMLYRHAMLRGVAAGHFLRKVARTN